MVPTTFRLRRLRVRHVAGSQQSRCVVLYSHDQNALKKWHNYCHSPCAVCSLSSLVFAQNCRNHLHILVGKDTAEPGVVPQAAALAAAAVAAVSHCQHNFASHVMI